MRKWWLVAFSALPLVGAAYAADLPVRRAAPSYKAPAYVQPITNPWTGLYGGINGGYGWERFRSDPQISTGDGAFGVQVGYNWAPSNWLFGIEGDIQGTTGHIGSLNTTCGGVACSISAKVNGFGTARGRVGMLFGQSLVYATGGLAFASTGAALSVGPTAVEQNSTWKAGYAIGGGVEQMFAPRWSAKLEYLYMAVDGPSLTAAGTTETFNLREHLVRVGLNYHF